LKDKLLAPLVEQFGAESVWDAGLSALGYPATMNHSTPEVLRIANALRGGSNIN
jgi:hypothetical protein